MHLRLFVTYLMQHPRPPPPPPPQKKKNNNNNKKNNNNKNQKKNMLHSLTSSKLQMFSEKSL